MMDMLAGLVAGDGGDDPSTTVEHESGAERLLNSVIVAFCCAPLALLLGCVLIGFNEKNAVCNDRALTAASEAAHLIDCTKAPDDITKHPFVNLKGCDLDGTKPELPGDYVSCGINVPDDAIGISVQAQVYWCIENSDTNSKKNSAGGGKTHTTTYTYEKGWTSTPASYKDFHNKQDADKQCGIDFQQETMPKVPASATRFSSDLKVGVYSAKGLESSIFVADSLDVPKPELKYGKLRYEAKYWKKGKASVLGQLSQDKTFGPWTAPPVWMCDKTSVSARLALGDLDKDAMIQQAKVENQAMMWILRIVGFALMWCAIAAIFAPLGVVADCIPCVGPYIGDAFETIACCISCLPAAACCLFIGSIMWVAMRPMLAIPAMAFFVFVIGAFCFFKMNQKPKTTGDSAGGDIAMTSMPAAP